MRIATEMNQQKTYQNGGWKICNKGTNKQRMTALAVNRSRSGGGF